MTVGQSCTAGLEWTFHLGTRGWRTSLLFEWKSRRAWNDTGQMIYKHLSVF